MEEPETTGEIRRKSDGTFEKGVSGNPSGRPPGTSIKDRVRKWLEEHPDDMQAFVNHFVKDSRDLAWQMLEGRPHQATDVTSAGQPLILPASLMDKNDLNKDHLIKNDSPPDTGTDSRGQAQV